MTSSPISGQSGSTCLNSPKDIDHHEDTEMEIGIIKNSALGERRPQVLITETFSLQDQENTQNACLPQSICPGGN
jgi:predicted signal transduction protein with EAL and GGDEF domain